ncbi:MAG: ParB/Srx family N-terminal domain-containing protein [Chloroflexota bacterium]
MRQKKNTEKAKVYCAFDKMVPLAEIKPNPKNPNQHPQEQIALLAKIITEQGWRCPITVSTRSGYIVRWHCRLEAARRAGLKEAPVDYQDYETDEAEIADLIADNKIHELSILDEDLALELVRGLDQLGFDVELAGYDREDIIKGGGNDDDDDEKPEVEFSEELLESHNYIVLKFENDIDWLNAQTFFGLKPVQSLDSRPGFYHQGVGRVIEGGAALNTILEAMK